MLADPALAASAQQDDVAAHDVRHVLLLAGLLVVPGIGSDSAFDINLATLFQIFTRNLRESIPENNVVPLGAVLPLALFIFVALVGCQGEPCHWLALRRVLDLGVLAQ